MYQQMNSNYQTPLNISMDQNVVVGNVDADTYQMESEVFDLDELRASEAFHVKKYVNALYFGELEGNMRMG